ncbi:MAG: hypothetical protein LBJ31_07075 [Treponema sp.]|jgi:putative FmdB family regulatory protein|nr:hypothetical protein [Treponema sp.]
MPTYEYECKECGYDFEIVQKMSDDPLAECPECGGVVRRLINGGAGVIFKGSGFYVTDKNKATKTVTTKNSKAETDQKKEKKEGAKEGGTKESCPAAASCPAASKGSCPQTAV